ncbi:hypothetical protein [Streptomyces sp. NBC_00239]|uniref:hypothetical protein n=1 Tax=Streptomyces sp. NBC_00239 TaxID=2903640 RepID=UPI002E2E1201|nr:hypothetical protein [Streptomyces sp. NBC_00239]
MGEVEDTQDPRIRLWAPVAQAVALLLGPYAEVVLHDPDTDRVLGIWNPMTSRGVRPLAAGRAGRSRTLGTGRLRAVREAARRRPPTDIGQRGPSRSQGRPSAVLCINLDRTPLEQAAAILSAFGAPTVQRPEPLFEQDWSERIQHTSEATSARGGAPSNA